MNASAYKNLVAHDSAATKMCLAHEGRETARTERRVPALTDAELIRLCAEGSGEAMAEIARRYERPLRRFLERRLEGAHDVEQATWDVFVRAWEHAGRFRHSCQVSTWLFTIARNMAYDMSTRSARLPQVPWPEDHQLSRLPTGDAEGDALARMLAAERRERVRRAMTRLSDGHRELLVMRYGRQCSYEEMEQATSLPVGVLKVRLHRARQRLRDLIIRSEV